MPFDRKVYDKIRYVKNREKDSKKKAIFYKHNKIWKQFLTRILKLQDGIE